MLRSLEQGDIRIGVRQKTGVPVDLHEPLRGSIEKMREDDFFFMGDEWE